MKAKQYYELFINNQTSENVQEILKMFIDETLDLIKKRNAQTLRAYEIIINEVNIKWIILNKSWPTYFIIDMYKKEICQQPKIKELFKEKIAIKNRMSTEFEPLSFDEKEAMNEGKKRFQQTRGHRT
ncbi:hypothetical protein M0Q97_13325 [Candidatus Dojkabacteria bacterium]|jgi:hypothetical protein|nr:hypothetical protein [Candidatus Dojkabacteria bacterium]